MAQRINVALNSIPSGCRDLAEFAFFLWSWFHFWELRSYMTSTTKALAETRIKKFIPYFVVGKLAIFTGFLVYMIQG